jgi:hypothetical protein
MIASCRWPTGNRARPWPSSPLRQGWEVRRIKIDDGCYEIDGRDAQGRAIEVKLHPGTLQIVEFEFEDDDHGREREGQEND